MIASDVIVPHSKLSIYTHPHTDRVDRLKEMQFYLCSCRAWPKRLNRACRLNYGICRFGNPGHLPSRHRQTCRQTECIAADARLREGGNNISTPVKGCHNTYSRNFFPIMVLVFARLLDARTNRTFNKDTYVNPVQRERAYACCRRKKGRKKQMRGKQMKLNRFHAKAIISRNNGFLCQRPRIILLY